MIPDFSRFNFALKFLVVLIAGAGILVLLNTAFIKPSGPIAHYEPTKDFSFLKRFYCISDLFDKEQWQDNKGRSFDEKGAHLTNLKTHTVNACHYALFCYDEFKTTGDSAFYKGFMDQVRYLRDTANYDTVDGDKIGYPYNSIFHDLKPPFYSALAQSEAICVLIRYYALTKDKEVLPMLVKIKNFMIAPQEIGCGTMSITPEGHVWYEEYPNSKQERQVINGFLLTVIAFHEYCQLFPDDKETRELYKESIQTVKETFKFFDTGSWLKYNRGDGRLVANGYMKWQILEMKLLYELTNDIYFKHIMMLVSSYCYNKPFESAGSKLAHYDFSVPLVAGKNDMLEFTGKNKQVTITSLNATVTTSYLTPKAEITKIFDANTSTFTRLKYTDSLSHVPLNITFDLKSRAKIGSFSISYKGLDSLDKPKITLMYTDSVNQKKQYKSVVQSEIKDANGITYYLNKFETKTLIIVFENFKHFRDIQITNVAFFEPTVKVDSDFMHYISPVYKSGSETVNLNFEYKGMKDIAIFHKSAKDEKTLNLEKWDPLNVYKKTPVAVNSSKDKLHKFLIICEPQKSTASIGKVKFTN